MTRSLSPNCFATTIAHKCGHDHIGIYRCIKSPQTRTDPNLYHLLTLYPPHLTTVPTPANPSSRFSTCLIYKPIQRSTTRILQTQATSFISPTTNSSEHIPHWNIMRLRRTRTLAMKLCLCPRCPSLCPLSLLGLAFLLWLPGAQHPHPDYPKTTHRTTVFFYDDQQDAEGSPDPEFAVEPATSEGLSGSSRSIEVPQVSSSKHSSFAQASSNASSPPNQKYHSPASPSNFNTDANTPDSNMSNTYINTLSPSPTPEVTSIAQTEETKQMDNPPIPLDDAYGPHQDHITVSNTGSTLLLVPIPDQFVPSLVDVTAVTGSNIHHGEETFDFPEDDVEECHINGAYYYYSVTYGTFVPIIPDADM